MRKSIIVSLLLLMALVITFTSCEAETNAPLSISTPPQAINEDDKRALDPFLDDLNAEVAALFGETSTSTQLQKDISALLNEITNDIGSLDVTHTKGEGSLSFAFSSEEEKDDSVLLTFTNYEVSKSDLRKYYLTGTINCFFDDSGFFVPDSSTLTIKYKIGGDEFTNTLNKASGDNSKTEIDGNEVTLEEFFNDIIANEKRLEEVYLETVYALMSNKGLTFDTTFGDVFVKGDIYRETGGDRYIYLNPIRLLLEKPIIINDKEYNGKVELKVEIIFDGAKLTIIDFSVAFNLAVKIEDVTNNYGGLVEFYFNTRPTGGLIPAGTSIPLKIDIKSFNINGKAIRPDDVYAYAKVKLATN